MFAGAMELDDRPRLAGDAASLLAGEDLAPYSQDELTARIALLRQEIARVERHRDAASAHRHAAEALFARPARPAPSDGDGDSR